MNYDFMTESSKRNHWETVYECLTEIFNLDPTEANVKIDDLKSKKLSDLFYTQEPFTVACKILQLNNNDLKKEHFDKYKIIQQKHFEKEQLDKTTEEYDHLANLYKELIEKETCPQRKQTLIDLVNDLKEKIMALIPNLIGIITNIQPLEENYYKAKVTIIDAEQNYPTRKLQEPQIVKLNIPQEEAKLKIGDKVCFYAFTLDGKNLWESEGHRVL